MSQFEMNRWLVFVFRLLMGWTFLYAGVTQVMSDTFSAAGLLEHTKTFHDVYAPLAAPSIVPIVTILVSWGHLLIGLSLVVGLLVRVSGVFAVALMLAYWTAQMDFPYIGDRFNFLVDYHLVYAFLIGYLVAVNAGYAFGLDGWLAQRAKSSGHAAPA